MSVTDLPPLRSSDLPKSDNESLLDDSKPPKRGRGRPKGASTRPKQPPPLSEVPKKEPDNSQIERTIGSALAFTSIVHKLDTLPNMKCDYCANHVVTQAPDTAKDLVKLSEEHPALRGALVGITRFFSGMSLMGTLGDLYAPSVIHHGPQNPMLDTMGRVAYPDMPDRKPKVKKQKGGRPHAHSQATAGTQTAKAEPSTDPLP